MRCGVSILLSLALLADAHLLARRGLEKCKNLQASSNNGGRKIAIVIDESGSMATSDPYDLRIPAGKAVNDWLISSKEAGNGKSADLVTVIGFDDSSRILYSLGDPSGADAAIDQISILGGTYIAGGIDDGISQLTGNNDPTANRSGIVVLTDGSDTNNTAVAESIKTAGGKGIRVSFGFLEASTYSFSYQDPEVLTAILGTGGMYATIDGATAQNAFVNLMIAHGLTDNDNPSSKNTSTAYNGLSVAFVLGEDGTSSVNYMAEAGESLTFSISSVAAGDLNVTAIDSSGKDLGEVSVDAYSQYSPGELHIKATADGNLQIKFQGEANQTDALFIIGTNSSIPLVNCTLGDGGGKSVLSTGAKAGIGIGVPLAVGLAAAGSYFAYKYFKGTPPTNPNSGAPPPYHPDQPAMEYKQPYMQTTSVPPSPWPTNTHPGWAMPPMKPPQMNPNNPNDGKPDSSNPNSGQPQQPHNFNQNAPHNPNSGQPQQPHHFNQNAPPPVNDGHPQHPNFNQPQQPLQGDPSQPSHPSGDAPANPNSGDPSQPSHPSQDGPANPNSGDPSHQPNSNSGDPSQQPYNPNSGDPSHQPSNPNSGGPDQPNYNPNSGGPDQPNLDRGGPDYTPNDNSGQPNAPSNPNSGGPDQQPTQPNQGDGKPTGDQPPQNNNNDNPKDDPPHPKRLRIPRIPPRLLGRRKKDKQNQQQQNLPELQQPQAQAPGQPQWQQPQAQGYPQAYAQPQQNYSYPQIPSTGENTAAPQQYRYQYPYQYQAHAQAQPDPQQQQQQQYAAHQYQPANTTYYTQSPPPQQYPQQPPSQPTSPPHQYAFPMPPQQPQSPPPQSIQATPAAAYAQPVQAQEFQMQRGVYNVSPIQQQDDAISPVNTGGYGSVARRPVGGPGQAM